MSGMHRTYRFAEGRLVKAERPEWFAKAIANSDEDWSTLLSRAGAIGMEDFDSGGESLDTYEGPQGEYFIGYWDAAKCVIEVFIDNVADYIAFRAQYIAPLAQLIMESERHDVWQEANKRRAA